MPDELRMLWRMNQACGLRCPYCFRTGLDAHRAAEHPDCGRHDPEEIAGAFDRTGHIWRIHMTGGEPLLYPRFIELAVELTRSHRISVNTSLTGPGIDRLAETVSPERVHSVNATLHLLGGDGFLGVDVFLERFLGLQGRSFNVRLLYVTYPPLLARMERDLAELRDRGVRQVRLEVFRGTCRGQPYPASYGPEQKALLLHLGLPPEEREILLGRTAFRGWSCAAGHTAFDMDVSGNITRCSGVPAPHGNLFRGDFARADGRRPCPAAACACPYQGLKFARKGGRGGIMRLASYLMKRTRTRTDPGPRMEG